MSKIVRGARFTILDSNDPANQDADYIILDIPTSQVAKILEELRLCQMFVDAERAQGKEKDDNHIWCVYLTVKAEHPKMVGPDQEDDPPSLLSRDIPRE